MLTKIATSLTRRLQRKGVVSNEAEDIYVYGFELLVSFVFSTTLILTLGWILDAVLETFCFLGVFILLRSFTGGYHANKYWQCTAITLSVYTLVMMLSKNFQLNIMFYELLFVVGLIVIIIMAPIENCNKPLSNTEKEKHKRVSAILFVVFCLLSLLCYNNHPSLSASIFYALIVDLLMMLISVATQQLILKSLKEK